MTLKTKKPYLFYYNDIIDVWAICPDLIKIFDWKLLAEEEQVEVLFKVKWFTEREFACLKAVMEL